MTRAVLLLAALGSVACAHARVPQVHVPAGTFVMGNQDPSAQPPPWAVDELPGEQPAHAVRITKEFWIDTYEVTNAEFQRFIDAGGYRARGHWSPEGWTWLARETAAGTTRPQRCGSEEPALPRVCVTWYEADAYARWRGGRLPTEAEWEYAARGPESRVYPWGNTFDPARANVVDATALQPVGTYPQGASWIGALDMSGNAMEWVQDWYSTTYRRRRVGDDPPGPESGTRKIEKGGFWGGPVYCARASYRHFEDPPEYADHHIGFRIVSDRRR